MIPLLLAFTSSYEDSEVAREGLVKHALGTVDVAENQS